MHNESNAVSMCALFMENHVLLIKTHAYKKYTRKEIKQYVQTWTQFGLCYNKRKLVMSGIVQTIVRSVISNLWVTLWIQTTFTVIT